MASPHTPATRAGRIFAWACGAFLIVVAAGLAWIGVRGAMAYAHLDSARSQILTVAQSVDDGPVDASVIEALGADLRSAHDLTSDPVWRAAEGLPWVGPQISAVREVAAVGAELAASALGPASELLSSFSLDSFLPENGQIDLKAIEMLHDAAVEAAPTLRSSEAALRTIDERPLIEPLREQLTNLESQLNVAATLSETAIVLPSMLGADGPRTWLLLFQNNAELRSLGGMPGATAVITIDEGRISLDDTGTASIPRFDAPVIQLGEERLAIFSDRPAVWFSGTTILPDFRQAAPAAREMWTQAHGVEVDGVVSLDPFALAYLLRATGPITLPTGEDLTSENVVDVLLSDVYFNYPDPAEQNDVFASATAAIFGAFMEGSADMAVLLDALTRAAEERRLLLWSRQDDEQAIFHHAAVDGALPETDDNTARFGVYLNDGTGSKLGPYLEANVQVACGFGLTGRHDTSGASSLTIRLENTAPLDAATSLPPSIAGGNYGVPAGVLRVVTYIYLPEGATLSDATAAPQPGFGSNSDGAYRVLTHQVDLSPGETADISVVAELSGSSVTKAVAETTPAFWPSAVSSSCGGGAP